MEHNCTKCGKCCKDHIIFITLADVNRWLEQEKFNILSVLTWHHVSGSRPPYRLMFPKKFHATIHSFVKELVPNDWKDKDECIFLKDNKCIIYADRPLACISFPPPMIESCKEVKNITDSDRIAFQIYNDMKIKDYHQIAKDREMLSKLIQKAKERASKKELKEMFEVDLNAEKKEM